MKPRIAIVLAAVFALTIAVRASAQYSYAPACPVGHPANYPWVTNGARSNRRCNELRKRPCCTRQFSNGCSISRDGTTASFLSPSRIPESRRSRLVIWVTAVVD